MDPRDNTPTFDGFIPPSPIDFDAILSEFIAPSTASAGAPTVGAATVAPASAGAGATNDVATADATFREVVDESKEPIITSSVATTTSETTSETASATTTVGNVVVEPTILQAPSVNSLTEIDIFLEQARRKELEKQNTQLKDAIDRYKDKCENLVKDVSRALDDRNSARGRISLLKQANDALEQQNNALEDKLAKNKKEYQRKLDEARRDLKEEKRFTDEATRTLRENRSLVAESELQIERLTRKVQQLEDLLASELEQSRGERMYPPYPIARMRQQFMPPPTHRMSSFSDGASATYMQSKHRLEHDDIDCHYASKEHPTKRRAGEGNLRDSLDLKLQSAKNKRFCYFGDEKCQRKHCNFAHSVYKLEVCPLGIRCNSKLHCGYMIHSEDERKKLIMSMQSSGKMELLCEEYDKFRTCKDGERCKKFH